MRTAMVPFRNKNCCHQHEWGDPSPLVSAGETHLECCIWCWAGCCRNDIDTYFQQKTAKIIKELEHVPNKKCLIERGLFSL